MRTCASLISPVFFLLVTYSGIAQPIEAVSEPTITERGPHHRVWEQKRVRTLPNGRSVTNRSTIVELETGMHHLKDGQWVESREEIELFQNGAVGRSAGHQAIFAPNINTAGAIDLLTTDGKRFRSHVLGLGVFDTATGKSELIAEVKDSLGELHPPNKIFYKDAFDGVRADLRYTYRKGGFVQDVIVLEGIELPADFNPATTRLEVWTEFIEAPVPQKTQQVRRGMEDETLQFGDMRIGSGKAFALGEAATRLAPVAKRWLKIEGRTFLVEAVQFAVVKVELDHLPASRQQAALRRNPGVQLAAFGVDHRPFPALRQVRIGAEKSIQTSSLPAPHRGFVLDYDLGIGATNFTFQADTTYYVSGETLLDGITTFEGGTVIKYAPTNSASLQTSGEVNWKSDEYRPVVFTARDDHSVGAQIGSAALSGKYADIALYLAAPPINPLRHLRISHAGVGIQCYSADLSIQHAQFIRCTHALNKAEDSLELDNVLAFEVNRFVFGSDLAIRGRHLTVHRCGTFHFGGTTSAALTNSLFIYQTNWGSLSKNLSSCYETNAAVFQTVGAASHYLDTNSPFRNIGTTNISSALRADLKARTTYPPLVMPSGWFSNSVVLYPQAQRDADLPDLGYHYAPIDYVFGGALLTNATLVLTNGVVIGTHTSINGYGLALYGGANVVSIGTPVQPNRIVRFNTVQEQSNTNWTGFSGFWSILTPWLDTSPGPQSFWRFTDWSTMGVDHSHFEGFYLDTGTHTFVDCQFHGGTFASTRPHMNLTNCLFERTFTYFQDDGAMNMHVRNSTFRGSEMWLAQYGTGEWSFKDNLFDGVALYQDTAVTNNHNAYTTNATRLFPNGANDRLLTVTNVAYQTGRLGYFYLPTNSTSHSVLLSTGSRTAAAAGLYHYTTSTNQTKDASSQVDIGFHYVAVNSSGQPIDTDNDGLPDCFEDVDGDGSADAGEMSWTVADTDGDGVSDYLEYLLGRNPLVSGTTNDAAGALGFRLYTPLK